jgi:hypothetical protein
MRILIVLVGLVSLAHADSSIPSPPPGGVWQERCRTALAEAQKAAGKEEAGFAAGKLEIIRNKVRFDVWIRDSEHARFYNGKPAHYFLEVLEKKSQASGELGADVMGPKDPQASAGLSKWTRERYANMDVQIAEYKKVEIFNRLFRPAMDACLR